MVSHATVALFSYILSSGCRYEILTPNAIPKGFMDGKQACEKMVCRGGANVSLQNCGGMGLCALRWGPWLGWGRVSLAEAGPVDGGGANCMGRAFGVGM